MFNTPLFTVILKFKGNLKIKPTHIFFIFTTFIFLSCSQLEVPSVNKSPEQISEFYINMDAAIEKAALIGGNGLGKNVGNARKDNNGLTKRIKTCTPFKSLDGTTNALYVINYEEGGFAVLSADKRTNSILAFSDTNSFPVDTLTEGAGNWLLSVKDEIDVIQKSDTPYTGQDKFNPFESEGEVKNAKVSVDDGSGDPPCTDQLTVKGPLLSTIWNQIGGYNNSMPLKGECSMPTYMYGRAYTGCVPTAMAQIVKYYQFPATWWNYSLMTNNVYYWETGSSATEISSLMSWLATAVGATYDCDGTGAYMDNAANVLKNGMGYSSSINVSNFNYATVVNEINANRPVILSGKRESSWGGLVYKKGHAWIADGVRTHFFCSTGGTYLYFNMNWGWGGDYNGWFGYASSAPGNPEGHNYQYGRQMITGIHP